MTENYKKNLIGLVVVLVSAFLSLYNLNHYSLWGDEALTALSAKGVLSTGDTSAWAENGNIAAYDSGACLTNLHDRSTPPLPAYLTAMSFAVFGVDAWIARLPFVLAGMLTIILMLYWARNASFQYYLLLSLAILSNVSFFLYSRQCRYYAPTMLFASLVVYFYWHWRGGKRGILCMSAASILLFASHYLAYLAVYICLLVDYFLWKRRQGDLSLRDWLLLLIPQIVCNGVIGLIWNPLMTGFHRQLAGNDFVDRMEMLFWHLRDMNMCEFFALPVVLLALVLAIKKKQWGLVRGCMAVLVACVVIACVTPQVKSRTMVADIRYVIYLLPLAIALNAGAIRILLPNRMILSILLATGMFFTNLFNGGMWFDYCGVRSTFFCYVHELLSPPNTDPYVKSAAWIREHLKIGESIFVAPHYHIYSLMFHAPNALYAWQMADHSDPQFNGLSAIHFKGEVMPDYLMGFGPFVGELKNAVQQYGNPKISYVLVDKIDVLWKDLYRPELFWRTFTPIENYDHNRDVVFIFKRVEKTGAVPQQKR
jgi:hypothetical protein